MPPYTVLEHTADTGLRITAPTREELFAEAVRGLTDIMVDVASVYPERRHRVEIQRDDSDALFVAWLTEVLFLYETKQFLACGAEEVACGDGSVHGVLVGESFDENRHALKTEVKAVTYHDITVRQTPEGWEAVVIVDL